LDGAKKGDSVVLASGTDVYDHMMKVPLGRLQTLTVLCRKLATKYNVDYCCTLTTGIQVNIAANASLELGEELPFWRTIKNDGSLNPKYPGGVDAQLKRLTEEGFSFEKKGRKNIKYIVKDFKKFVIDKQARA
jgi:hypothetical protein